MSPTALLPWRWKASFFFFLTSLNAIVFIQTFLLLLIFFNIHFFLAINLGLCELEQQRIQFLYDYKERWDAHPRLTFKLNCSLCVTEQIAVALEPNWSATAFWFVNTFTDKQQRCKSPPRRCAPHVAAGLESERHDSGGPLCKCTTHLYVKVIFFPLQKYTRISAKLPSHHVAGNFKSCVPRNKISFFIVRMNQASSFLCCDSLIFYDNYKPAPSQPPHPKVKQASS